MICNGSKRTMSTSGGLGLLQMVSKPNTERCASKDIGPSRGLDCEISHRLERGTKYFFIRVWKALPSRHVLKP